jgi:hypothetical protein
MAAGCSAPPPVRRAISDNPQMPRLAAFYGIVIWMYRPDHPPPHFHARYGEHVAQIALDGLRVLNGSLPPRALRLVREWARMHHEELADNWELAQDLEPLLPIEPLP